MGKYIDADKAYRLMEERGWYDNADRDIAEGIIDQMPTVDAVPVIRCKECMHCMFGFCTSRNSMPTDPDDFCSHGERRSDRCLSKRSARLTS